MKRFRTKRALIAAAAAILMVVSATIAVLAAPADIPPPTRPPYLLRDGVPVIDSLPRRVPVVDANGIRVGTVPRQCLFADPASLTVDCGALPRAGAGEVTLGE